MKKLKKETLSGDFKETVFKKIKKRVIYWHRKKKLQNLNF